MNTTEIREELHNAINQADDRLLNLIYAMVQADMQEADYDLGEAHKQLLEQRLKDHELNPNAGSEWNDVKERVKSKL